MPKKDDTSGKGPPAGAGKVDLTTHPLVERLRAETDDIKAPPDNVSLVGYIGPSKRPDYTRLYQDLTFQNYYEIPQLGIVSTTPINPDDEESPTHVEVKADTKLDVVTVSVSSIEARYLSGSISSGALGTAAGSAQVAVGQTFCTNITTHMPSCVAQPPCTNITTHMPSCVAQQQLCTNITTYMPSCVGGQGGEAQAAVAQTLCTNITTYMPYNRPAPAVLLASDG